MFSDCQWVERDPYADSKYTGKVDIYTCDEGGTSTVESCFALYPADKSYLAIFGMATATTADTNVEEAIFNSLNINI
jgi:hypothetical protein